MKLLEDQPAVDVEEPPHRPVMAILGGIAVLAVMLGVGVALLSTSESTDPQAGPPDTDEPGVTVDLASWVTSASRACDEVAARHESVVDSGEGSLTEVDLAVRSLAAAVRQIPLPTDRDERAEVLPVVLMGDEAEQAWYGISGLDREDVTDAELANADGLTRSFVAGMNDLGASCESLG